MLTGDLPKVDQAAAETIAAIVVTGLFRPDLKCFVLAVSYDFLKHGRLDMPSAECCSMGGCIDLFQKIDADVQRIETFAGGERDTTYIRHAKKGPRTGWHSQLAARG
jgi:hypothetical protein